MNRNPCQCPDESHSAKAVVRRRVIIRLVLGLALLFHAQVTASATTRTVTNLNDSGAGSLRQAIADSAPGDTINFSVSGTIALTSGELVVSKLLTINGPGAATLSITGPSDPRLYVFDVSNGTHNGPTVAISGLMIKNAGWISTSDGKYYGGGIYNDHGRVTVNDCEIDGNVFGITNLGSGTNFAAMTINNTTFVNNHIAIQNDGTNGGDAELNLANCTFSYPDTSTPTNNDAGINSDGTRGYASVILTSCTLSNDMSDIYHNFYNIQGSYSYLTTGNTIFSAPDGKANLAIFIPTSAYLTSNGYNLFTKDPGFAVATDRVGVHPQLDPNGPQYNGGSTRTIALTFEGNQPSPAIDGGYSFGIMTDQRGQPRPYDNANIPNASGGDGSDIGAYEAPSDPIQDGYSSLVVNTTADHDDGVCGGYDCTLREALQAVNRTSSRRITFASNVTGTITVQSPLVVHGATIWGPGARLLAISGGGAQRVLYTAGNYGNNYISGLTIRDGVYATTQNHGEARQGGAVYNPAYQVLVLEQCALVNNGVIGAMNLNNGGDGGAGQGGAIYNVGSLTLSRCTFSGNAASGNAGAAFSSSQVRGAGGTGGAGQGGAVFNDAGGTLVVNTSTFSSNTANGGHGGQGNSSAFLSAGGNANGAAIYNLGTMTVTSSTVSGNTGTGGAGDSAGPSHGPHGSGSGGLSAASSTSTIANTIIARNTGNTAPDAEGTFTSNGYNLLGIGDQSSGFTGTADQVGTTAAPIDPKLGPLQNNGGPTYTMALLAGSPAIDQGKYFPSFNYSGDQRLAARTIDQTSIPNASGGDGTDIGAFEFYLVSPRSAVSHKTHPGAPAGTGDIPLPLSGPVGIECRTGGATGDHQLVVYFGTSVTVTGNPQAQVTTGAGQIGTGGTSNGGVVSLDQSKSIVTVPLTNVANQQRIVVTLFSVSDGININDVTIPMGVLLGDVNGNGLVNSTDTTLVQAQSGKALTLSNFRMDVNANGLINSTDTSIVQSKSGTGLP